MPAEEPRQSNRLVQLSNSAEFGKFTRGVVLAALIGLLGGVAAVAFRWMIEFVAEHAFRRPAEVTGDGVESYEHALLVLLIPTLGGLLVGWLVTTFAPEAEGHGTDSVIRAFHRLKGVVRKRVIFMKAIASAITIGTGGSAGQEGPVAQVGAGIGSSLASALKLSDRDRRIFLMCGASAGIGAMFCSPLGGALFMPAVMYRKAEFEGEAIIPCIISSFFAFTTFTWITGEHRAVEIAPEVIAELRFNDPRELVAYLVLGLVCAALGWLFTKCFYGVHDLFSKIKRVPKAVLPAIGGLLLGCLALALSPYTGENGVFFGGYGLIQASIAGQLAIPTLLVLAVAKILATSFTISSGGSGGVFAPALAIGALIGAAVGQSAAPLLPGLEINAAAFALVGMGGFFAGVAKVPVAAVIMVSEMTGSYGLLAPSMLVAVVCMLLSTRWTMYRAQVGSQVDSPAHAGDFVIDVLQSMTVKDVIGEMRMPRLIHEDVTLKGAMRIVRDSHETHFPVVDDEERLVGIFSLTDLRRIFLENVVEDFVIVGDFMREQVVTVRLEDSLDEVVRKMTRKNISAVPVVDSTNARKVVGFLERNTLGRAYSDKLKALKEGG